MSLLVKIDGKKDEKFISELLRKLGYSSKSVDLDELEDIAFGSTMKKNKRGEVLAFNDAKAVYKRLSRKN